MKILLTDHPWHDLSIESEIFDRAGFEFVHGPGAAGSAAEIEALVGEANPVAIMTCWAPVSAKSIALPRSLAVVARMGVGLDNIDVAAATARGAWVTNVPAYCVQEVAVHALALTLAAERHVVALARDVRNRGWHAPELAPRRVSELVVGIIGYGRIGRETARYVAGLGCEVLAFSPSYVEEDRLARPATIPQIQAQCDIIILHAPLSANTELMIDRDFLERCRKCPLIVNVSRGGLIDNEALIAALDQELIRGAALDVIEGEPSPPAALLQRDDVIVTPHIAYLSASSMKELRRTACEDVVRVLRGDTPVNGCNRPAGLSPPGTLPGGVSSDVELQVVDDQPIVIKTALPQLKVAAEWLSDPRRSAVEVRALRVAADLIGSDAVPRVLWEDTAANRFAMEYIGPPMRNWKEELLRGVVDCDMMVKAGRMLARLHSQATKISDLSSQFADKAFFEQLRIQPFFQNTAAKLPDVAGQILTLADRLRSRASTLVHGDFSPKNLLTDGTRLIILDFEVAHWGDPAFDVAFFVSHLLLKSFHMPLSETSLRSGAQAFLNAYASEGGVAEDDGHLAGLVAALMLARTDGDSPVDYLSMFEQNRSRTFAMAILNTHPASLSALLAQQEPAK